MEITIKNLQKKTPINQVKIIKAAQQALKVLRLELADLSLVFVGRVRMRSMNKKFLKHDFVTDVITFNLKGVEMSSWNRNTPFSGEIIICPSVAVSNAKHYALSSENEIILYVLHGILHLAGYDDHNVKDIQRMRLKEEELLRLCL